MKQILVILVAAFLLFGCVNIADTAKASAFGKNAKEKKALDYFTKKYGDPTGTGAPRFIEPFMTTSVADFMPADKVLKYGTSAPEFIVWFFYDNFGVNDAITVTFTYLDDNTVVHTFNSKGGGDYGAATFTLQAPEGGWPIGNYEVAINGKGAASKVDFEVVSGATVATALPYEEAAGAASGTVPEGTPKHLSNCAYSGSWSTDWGTMVLTQSGSTVTGTYEHDSGKLVGTLTDGVFVGKWSESPSYSEPNDAGDEVFYFTNDCNSFTGTWQYGVHTTGAWSGTWVGSKVSATPQPAATTTTATTPATTAEATSDAVAFETDPGYIGACDLTDTSDFTLTQTIHASLLQVWYNWGSGESTITYTLKKGGADFASGTMVRADCDPYQGNWCNGNYKLTKDFTPGAYQLKVSASKMCLEPGKTGAVRIYGTTSGAAAAPAGQCTIVGDWAWFNHEHVYIRADGTLDAWDNGVKTLWGTWAKNAGDSYTLTWNAGYVDDLVLSSGCSKLSGDNQYSNAVSANKLSSTVPSPSTAAPSAVLPADVPAHLANCVYAGSWSTDWGAMQLAQAGTAVTGNYTWDSGKVAGTLVNGVFVGKWSESPSYSEPGDAGDMVFYFTDDCNSFTGNWNYGVHTSGAWSGGWVGSKVS